MLHSRSDYLFRPAARSQLIQPSWRARPLVPPACPSTQPGRSTCQPTPVHQRLIQTHIRTVHIIKYYVIFASQFQHLRVPLLFSDQLPSHRTSIEYIRPPCACSVVSTAGQPLPTIERLPTSARTCDV